MRTELYEVGLTRDKPPVEPGSSIIDCSIFEKTGDRLIEFDVSYIVQETGDDPKVILFITHQDEEEAMRELGLQTEAAQS